MAVIGDNIRIINMYGRPQYNNKTGVITKVEIDPWGEDMCYCGTWGEDPIYPDMDSFELNKKE